MSSRSFTTTMRALAREAARAERARQQAQRASDVAQRRAAADATREYQAAKLREVEISTKEIRDREEAIENVLVRSLTKNPVVDLNSLLKTFEPARFDDSQWSDPAPDEAYYNPRPPRFFARLIPGTAGRHKRRITEFQRRLETARGRFEGQQRARAVALAAFEKLEGERKAEIDRENEPVRDLQRRLKAADHQAVVSYFKLVMERNLEGEPDALSAEIGYSPGSKHLVVDLELPDISAIPEETGFRYVKSADRIDPIARPDGKRKALYGHLIGLVALKAIDTVFRAATDGIVECLTLNGMLDTINPATGHQERVCLLSVRLTEDTFRNLNLAQVQPEQCLRSLKASISRSPAELAPVKPFIQLDMVDPRFVETIDVMSSLDQHPNLMDLSPTEFEGLITTLFGRMGLETRQTQASRDGGVDCVAFDSRAIFGGKVVIQAKRYKNTVGVSAVRDLFGTMQNEGANKGILVTTSGYGKAAWDFAAGKPLELIDGGNLLHLLSEHAGIEARIVTPETWVDLPVHGN